MVFEYHTLQERGWRAWAPPQDGKVLLLCPEIDFDNVPDGTVMQSIIGPPATKGVDDIDKDTRCGLLAFGVIVDAPPSDSPKVHEPH